MGNVKQYEYTFSSDMEAYRITHGPHMSDDEIFQHIASEGKISFEEAKRSVEKRIGIINEIKEKDTAEEILKKQVIREKVAAVEAMLLLDEKPENISYFDVSASDEVMGEQSVTVHEMTQG